MAIPAKLVEQVLELPEDERRELRELLDGTLENNAVDLDPAWDAELERRIREIDDGTVQTISRDDFEAHMREKRAALAAARAKRG
jgi:putative addiction module component (TIGR02574 family)